MRGRTVRAVRPLCSLASHRRDPHTEHRSRFPAELWAHKAQKSPAPRVYSNRYRQCEIVFENGAMTACVRLDPFTALLPVQNQSHKCRPELASISTSTSILGGGLLEYAGSEWGERSPQGLETSMNFADFGRRQRLARFRILPYGRSSKTSVLDMRAPASRFATHRQLLIICARAQSPRSIGAIEMPPSPQPVFFQ